MAARTQGRYAAPLAAALGIGLALRLLRIARTPLVHPDSPAYLGLASQLLDGNVMRVLGGYYSPLYPAGIAALRATGLPPELAGRLLATLAGLAMLPLLHVLTRRLYDARTAAVVVLVAAVHPELVKASAQVLPETMAGALLLGWLVLLLRGGTLAVTAAGALAGGTYLARPEGVMLVPLGLVLGARRARVPALAAYAVAAGLVMLPVLQALHARTGHWQLSPREARLEVRDGLPGDTLVDALRENPATVIGRTLAGGVQQAISDLKALGPLLWVPFVAGLVAAPPTGLRAWPLIVTGTLTALPLALNPSSRYAVPLVPLLLPWVGVGLLALGARLETRARPVAVALAVALAIQALWISHPGDAACWREVSQTLRERYPGEPVVAVDGRFAYGAGARAVVPGSTRPEEALALARRNGARVWLTRPAWIRKPWQPPPGARAVARPCGGTFVLFELAR
jgi:hypothetical protein